MLQSAAGQRRTVATAVISNAGHLNQAAFGVVIIISHIVQTKGIIKLTLRQTGSRMDDVVKVGRTQFQDAVLTTLGFEFKAYAEALNYTSDAWRESA